MSEKEDVDPVLHIVEKIREVVNKNKICFTEEMQFASRTVSFLQ